MTGVEVAFLKQPGGGRAEVLVDGEPSGEIDLDGAADERATLDVNAADHGAHGFHDIAVRSLTDAPVTVTGVEVDREGDGVSYISLGFPGATVQLLQKLADRESRRRSQRMAPDIIVLAFGTNEGFNDALDVAAYTAQYEQIVRAAEGASAAACASSSSARPTARAPTASAKPGVGQDCATAPQTRGDGGGTAVCRRRPSSRRCARRSAGSAMRLERRFLGLVVGDAGPMRRAGLGRGQPAADGARLRAHDAGRL